MNAIDANDRSREDDYQDYEARDVETGWPYKDGLDAGNPTAVNPDYGSSRSAPDGDPNNGYRVTGIDGAGNEARLRDGLQPATTGRENSDDIEERVTDNISTLDDVNMDSIDVHADGHLVTLEGSVDDVTQKRRVELAAMSVDGVHNVRNRLELLGADSHMPDDE